MSVFSYNGITIEITETNSISRTPIYDANTYSHTKYLIDVKGVYNPRATSYQLTGDNNTGQNEDFEQEYGNLPAETDAAIYEKLMQPRGQLLFTDDDGNEIIRSPRTGKTVDVANGPFPLECQVYRQIGTTTWQVRFVVETNVKQTDIRSNQGQNPVLSHTWKMTEGIDEFHRTVRVIEGHVIFNTEVLVSEGRVPDDYRRHLFPEPPSRFKRVSTEIAVDVANNRLEYVLTDKSVKWYYKQRGIVDVQVIESFGAKSSSSIDIARGGVSGAVSGAGRVASSHTALVRAGSRLHPAAAAVMVGTGIASGISSMLPGRFLEYNITVTGSYQTNIAAVSAAAHAILNTRRNATRRATGTTLSSNHYSYEIKEIQIIHENTVKLSATYTSGLTDAFFNLGQTVDDAFRGLRSNYDWADPIARQNPGPAVLDATIPRINNGSAQERIEAIMAAAAQDSAFRQDSVEGTLRRPQVTADPLD